MLLFIYPMDCWLLVFRFFVAMDILVFIAFHSMDSTWWGDGGGGHWLWWWCSLWTLLLVVSIVINSAIWSTDLGCNKLDLSWLSPKLIFAGFAIPFNYSVHLFLWRCFGISRIKIVIFTGSGCRRALWIHGRRTSCWYLHTAVQNRANMFARG